MQVFTLQKDALNRNQERMIFAHRKRRKATVWMVLSLGLLTSPAAALDVTLDKWHVGVFSFKCAISLTNARGNGTRWPVSG